MHPDLFLKPRPMQANTTDFIAKLTWQHTKTQWKAFVASPIAGLFALGLISMFFGWTSQWIGIVGGILGFLTGIASLVFMLSYGGATTKWCEELYKGASTLDIQAGYRYGLSRVLGSLGTAILMAIKIFLWTLLLVLPGYYKMIQYKHSVAISRLEKISGNKATRLSQKLVMEAGWLRTLGNMLSFSILWVLAFYAAMIPVALIGVAVGFIHPIAGMVAGGLVAWVLAIALIAFMANFNTFEFLVYRDENSKAFNDAKAALAKL